MRLPIIQGLIKRRLLVNFRVEAEVMQRFLPAPFRPKLHEGHAIAGICLIRLENVRPLGVPAFLGLSSENAAHRISVEWNDPTGEPREGVFIPRRDTDSALNHLAGGRIFPGEPHLSRFRVVDRARHIDFAMTSRHDHVFVHLEGTETEFFPRTSCFASLAESSAFFERGSVGFSITKDAGRLDGLRLETKEWKVTPLGIDHLENSFFSDPTIFPSGSVEFDHALIMRDIQHRWIQQPDLQTGACAAGCEPAAV